MGRCFLCGKNHPIKYCSDFRWMLKDERRAVLQKFRYCLNCLSDRHQRDACTSTKRCDVCGYAHHTMIHRDTVDPASAGFEQPEVREQRCQTASDDPCVAGALPIEEKADNRFIKVQDSAFGNIASGTFARPVQHLQVARENVERTVQPGLGAT